MLKSYEHFLHFLICPQNFKDSHRTKMLQCRAGNIDSCWNLSQQLKKDKEIWWNNKLWGSSRPRLWNNLRLGIPEGRKGQEQIILGKENSVSNIKPQGCERPQNVQKGGCGSRTGYKEYLVDEICYKILWRALDIILEIWTTCCRSIYLMIRIIWWNIK